MVKTISTPKKINAILLNIKINQPKLVDVCIYKGNKLAKFYENILSLSENIAKSFRGATFFDSHCILHSISRLLQDTITRAITCKETITGQVRASKTSHTKHHNNI